MTNIATAIADRIKRRPEARRTRQRLNAEFGKALELHGAARNAKLKRLVKLADDVPGYKIPKAALDALAPKVK